jgi:hypothetical protein
VRIGGRGLAVAGNWRPLGGCCLSFPRACGVLLFHDSRVAGEEKANGTVYGIELLNANKQLQREDMGELTVLNEATGEKTRMSLINRNTG